MARGGALYVVLGALLALPAAAGAQGVSQGQLSYKGVRVAGPLPAERPASQPAPYLGAPLVLRTADVGREAAEPTVGVTAAGDAFYAAGAFDSIVPGLAKTLLMRSRDGGLTWTSVQPKLASQDPYIADLDPYVYVEPESGRVFGVTLAGAGSFLSFSEDAGETWQFSFLSSPGVNDHQTLFAAPPPEGTAIRSSDPSFRKILYYCVNHASDARCVRSEDGGRTFLPAGAPAYYGVGPVEQFIGEQAEENELICSALTGHLAADSAGRIYLPSGHCGWPDLAVSDDGGTTWRKSRVSEQIPMAGIQSAVAVDAADNVYYLWWDSEHSLPYLAVSRDHGETWSEPLMIAPPGVKEVNFPTLIAGDAGRIAVTFPGSGSGDVDNEERPWDTWVTISTNALDPEPLWVAARANDPADPVHRGDCSSRCAGMFDFLDIVTSPQDGAVWATAVDTCTLECVPRKGPEPADDMRGLAVRQISGPWLVGSGPAADVTPVTARAARLACRRRATREARCSVRLGGAPAGARVRLTLERSGRRVARSAFRTIRSGRAEALLRSQRRLRAGRYRVRIELRAAGERTSAIRSVTLR